MYEGIGRVTKTIGDVASSYQDTIRKAEETRRKQEVGVEVDQLESGAEVQLANATNSLKGSVTDPDDYERQWTTEFERIRGETFAGAKYPESQAELQRKWAGVESRHKKQMLSAKFGLVVDGIKAGLSTHLDNRKSLAGQEPLTDDGDATVGVHLANIRVALDRAAPTIGPDTAATRWIGERNALLAARAEKWVSFDPAGFLARIDGSELFREMDPAKKAELTAKAQKEAKDQLATAEKAREGAMKTWKESVQRETAVHLEARTLTREWLDEYKYAFTDTELTAYNKSLDAQVYGGPKGNPAVVGMFQIDVYDPKLSPEQTRARLLQARRNDLVPDPKFTEWMNHLNGEINRRTGEARTERDKGETLIRQTQERNFNLTMGNIDRVFRTTTDFEKLLGKFDPVVEQAAAMFREEIQRQSTYTGRGNREADEIYRERLPHWLKYVESNAQARLGLIETDLKLKTATALRAAEATMPKDQWLEQLRLFNEKRAIERELILMKSRTTEGTTTPKPTDKPAEANKPARGRQ